MLKLCNMECFAKSFFDSSCGAPRGQTVQNDQWDVQIDRDSGDESKWCICLKMSCKRRWLFWKSEDWVRKAYFGVVDKCCNLLFIRCLRGILGVNQVENFQKIGGEFLAASVLIANFALNVTPQLPSAMRLTPWVMTRGDPAKRNRRLSSFIQSLSANQLSFGYIAYQLHSIPATKFISYKLL